VGSCGTRTPTQIPRQASAAGSGRAAHSSKAFFFQGPSPFFFLSVLTLFFPPNRAKTTEPQRLFFRKSIPPDSSLSPPVKTSSLSDRGKARSRRFLNLFPLPHNRDLWRSYRLASPAAANRFQPYLFRVLRSSRLSFSDLAAATRTPQALLRGKLSERFQLLPSFHLWSPVLFPS